MYTFSTKANTLKALYGNLTHSQVLPQVSFKVAQPINYEFAEEIFAEFSHVPLIVRSSALAEDQSDQSNAGKYLSILNVTDVDKLLQAINDVKQSCLDNANNQIFVQPMLEDIDCCGVIFTKDPSNGSNYYIINYDDVTGNTDSVTSGHGKNLKTVYISRQTGELNEKYSKILSMVQELECAFECTELDIEFAIKNDLIYLLQVRKLIVNVKSIDEETQQNLLDITAKFIENNMHHKPYLFGKKTIYTVMSDWNPAEMIGLRPRPLASSLYKRLITDGTWAYQRNNYGYKNLRSFPLMVDFFGLTYIDTRVSFNSFIPADINNSLSEKLVNYYLECLENNPDAQDKIEFDIVFSCFFFDIENKIKILKKHNFSQKEINNITTSLLNLTNKVINIQDGLWRSENQKIKLLEEKRKIILHSDIDIISKIYWLLEDCARYGTLPFAGLARAGFIAIQLLKSMVSVGILNQIEYENYMQELNTVSSTMRTDSINLSTKAFMQKYGHLRPGTYNILTKRYDEMPSLYFNKCMANEISSESNHFKLSLDQYQQIKDMMNKYKIEGDVLNLFEFIKEAIEGREYSKFIFTHTVSDVINLLKELGAIYGFSDEDMSYFDISNILELYNSACDIKSVISHSIQQGKSKYEKTLAISLPPVITNQSQVYSFELIDIVANYITLNSIEGEIISDDITALNISDKILLIEAADPGYDWIFSHKIRGFITAFGGANSHMAIRAGELNIPAVIGVGQKEFNRLSTYKRLLIDCANKKIEVLT
ncbi:MAG: phosphoenolpyruvate synthase [Epulopiscium sp. Nuni2H_MBin003]|nr:MAG: phosphoenolpyruvate synthase [Epulopiscium sp. Nuni2H_MBin003]